MKEDNFDETEFEEIDEWEDFGDAIYDTQDQNYEVEELTDDEAEAISGGAFSTQAEASAWLAKDKAKKGYKKHCGGIRLENINTTFISEPRVNARIGDVDHVYVTAASAGITYFGGKGKSKYTGSKPFTVKRKPGKLGLVTLELWGHKTGEQVDNNYMVLRVQFV